MIKRVPLQWNPSSFFDQSSQLSHRNFLRRIRAGVVVDLLMDDGAVDIIGAEAEGHLCCLDAEHDPIGFDVWEVIEHEPANGHRLQVHQAARFGDVGEVGILRMKRQGNESLEAAGFVL